MLLLLLEEPTCWAFSRSFTDDITDSAIVRAIVRVNPNEVKMYTDFRKKGVSRAAIEADRKIVRKDARKS